MTTPSHPGTPATKFTDLLREQVAHEFAAAQQYLATAVYYDRGDLPQLAAYFYRQAVEERNHAMMFVRHCIDRDIEVEVPGIDMPRSDFADPRAPIEQAVAQEQRVTQQIVDLARAARDDGDYLGEQFVQWFLAEQVEEVASMTTLRTVAMRAGDDLFDLENFVAREFGGDAAADPTAPPVAGGRL